MGIEEVHGDVTDDEPVESQVGDEHEAEEEIEGETPDDDQPESEEQPEVEDGVIVTIGDEKADDAETAHAEAPPWVKELRKQNREMARELREMKAKAATAAPKQEDAGPRPRMSDPNIDYDEDKFDAAIEAWQQKKFAADAAKQREQLAAEKQQQEWQAKLDAHGKAKALLRVSDYEEAEEVVQATFSTMQQGILINGAENSALLAYAIGKNPAKAKALADIKDPVKFAFALAKLETQVKTQPRKAAPPPEGRVRTNAPATGAVDSKLAALEKEADRTGDRSKVAAYYRERSRQAA